MANEEHPVIRGLRWILENRTKPSGKPVSMRSLSLGAVRAESQVEQILNGRQSADLSLDLARDLARAGDVRVEWLLTGRGEPGHYEGEERVEFDRDAATAPIIDEVSEKLGLSDVQRRELANINWSTGTSFGTVWSAASDIVARDKGRSADRAIADTPRAEVIFDLMAEIEKKKR